MQCHGGDAMPPSASSSRSCPLCGTTAPTHRRRFSGRAGRLLAPVRPGRATHPLRGQPTTLEQPLRVHTLVVTTARPARRTAHSASAATATSRAACAPGPPAAVEPPPAGRRLRRTRSGRSSRTSPPSGTAPTAHASRDSASSAWAADRETALRTSGPTPRTAAANAVAAHSRRSVGRGRRCRRGRRHGRSSRDRAADPTANPLEPRGCTRVSCHRPHLLDAGREPHRRVSRVFGAYLSTRSAVLTVHQGC